jgi:hypothetical protein
MGTICRPIRSVVSLAILAFVSCLPLAMAQNISSTILGLVTDSSGAAVSGVQLTVTNEGTGISFKTRADNSGAYSVPNLQPGTYTVAAANTGFQTTRTTGVQLLASQQLRVNLQLKVGEMQQTISVTAEASLIKTESPTIGGTVSTNQMRELPVAQQSIDTVLGLTPGSQTYGGTSSPNMGGGSHWGSFNFTINGTQANDFGNGAAAYSYNLGLVSLPPLQSMQEFKVEAYNTNAEYKNLGTVQMVTKSGTNRFHGEAYEFNQNAGLNANTFVRNATGKDRAPAVNNQFGGNIGGPIRKNKAFFFFDYSGLRARQYGTPQLTLPGQAMRSGDFSALCATYDASGICNATGGTQLYNPWTGSPFSRNQIASSLITSQAKTLLSYLPLPNGTTNLAGVNSGGTNYFGIVPAAQTVNSIDLKLDYQISERDQIYGVWTRNIGDPLGVVASYPSTYGQGANYGYKTLGYSMAETHTFSPTKINEFRMAWFDHPSIRTGMNQDFDPTTLFPTLTKSPNRGLPTMTMTGYSGMFYDYGTGYYGHAPDTEFTDNFTWVRNRHTIKAGVMATAYKTYGKNPNAPLGTFAFSGQWTGGKGIPGVTTSNGNAFADFLIGAANSAVTGNAGTFEAVYSAWDTEAYVQDTWQASSRLTIYGGLRYMYQTPWDWQGDYSTYWDQATNKLALPQDSATPTLPSMGASAVQFAAYNFTTTQALGLPKKYMIGDKNNWGPRMGFAWRPFNNDRTVFRGGYGVYYNFNPSYAGSRDDVLNPPWVAGLSGFSGATTTYSTNVTSAKTTLFTPDITFSNPFPAANAASASAASHPTLYSMQRDFKSGVIQQWNVTLEHQFTNDWAARITYAGSQSHHLQWFFGDINIPNKMTPNVSWQNQRPYQPWGSILATRSGGSQNFGQLQLEATKRFSNGFSFQLEYSWTRSLDNVDYSGGPQNPNRPGLDYGNSYGIRRHVLVFNYVYELPVGHGKALLGNAGRSLDAVVGGWQVSGITNYMTGVPFSVSFSVPSSYTGWQSGRADMVAGAGLYAGRGSGHDIISGIQWYNPAAFSAPQPWNWGNSARNQLWGPGQWDWDISLAKSFRIVEGVRMQLRADAFDALNHFNLSNPSTTIADTRDGGSAISQVGMVTGGSGNRTVQVGARVTF